MVDVIDVRTVGAELKRRGGRGGRRARPARAEAQDEPEPVAVTRVTVIRGEPFEHADAARTWLAGCGDAQAANLEVNEALRLLNRAIHAHRVSAGDPYSADVSLTRARRVRLGYGTGDELVEGRWRDAYAVPHQAARTSRRRMLAPEEQTAGILVGRRQTHASEDLVLRARADLDQGRTRAAALQADAALKALTAELRAEEGAEQSRATLRERGEQLSGLAATALDRELDDRETAELGDVLLEMERIVRRRRHSAAGS